MLVIATHATSINGKMYEAPTSTLVEVLKAEKKDFMFLRHSMDGCFPSTLYFFNDGIQVRSRIFSVLSSVSLFRYATEVLSTVSFFLFSSVKMDTYIGVDPLNAFSGILLKKMGRVNRVVFYTADYSRERFKNGVLNRAYHLLDKFCVKNADYVWNVSSRICEIRKGQGLVDEKNIFVPNVPSSDYKKYLDTRDRKQHTLISLGIIGEQLDYIGIFDAIKNMKSKYPDIFLKIVGNGPKESEYRAYVDEIGLSSQVEFLGYLDHDRALEEISKSGIGLALYNGKWSFNYFGDSMKCREYFCFGLPVITTDTHSTVDDIRNAKSGVVCAQDKDSYESAISDVFENYDTYSAASFDLAKKYDAIHTNLLREFFV